MPISPRLFSGLALAAVLLSGCTTFKKEEIACPSIKVREGTESAAITGADQGDQVSLRIRKVETSCVAGGKGTEMRAGFSLMLERKTERPQLAERIPFDITFAFLGPNDEVVSRYVYSDDVHMRGSRLTTRPTVNIKLDVPDNTRVVFGLGRAQ